MMQENHDCGIMQPARSAVGRVAGSPKGSRRQSWYNMSMEKKTIILVVLVIIAIMNIAAFVLMGHDKKMARQGKWRVPEKRLFLVTACFGGLGGVLGILCMECIRNCPKGAL